jgi:hypothetical protein
VRRLGEVECRECGNVGAPASVLSVTDITATAGEGMTSPELAEEVEQAIAKVLRRKTRAAPLA